jgi:serine O-acetyltransferase
MLRSLRADLERALQYQEGSRLACWLRVLAAPGTHAVVVYRFGAWALGLPALLRWPCSVIYQFAYLGVRILWGIEVPRTAVIGPGFYIGHFGGITVARRAVIGRNCSLSQGVTIGYADGRREGVPAIGDDVYVGPGARLFGAIRIGDNVRIGANAVVYKDIPRDAVVALAPGFTIISFRGNRRVAAEVRSLEKRRNASTG